MANTVSTISYANTFGQWMVATDALIGENNTLASNDYTKNAGTLYLSETTKNALQSNGNIVVQKQLLVQGVGSSVSIDNNMTVGQQVYFTNTTLGLTNSGQANINGLLIAQGPGIGLYVANNEYIGGNSTIQFNTTTNNVQANSTVNTANASITGTVYTKNLTANARIMGAVASISGWTYTDTLQANTSVTTTSLQANTLINTAAIFVTGTATANTLQANNTMNTVTASITGNTYTNILVANTYITTPKANVSTILDANSAVGYFGSIQTLGQLSVGGNFVINGSTVYNSNNFTLNAGSSTAQISYINVNRGSSGGSNASIRWNETQKYFDVLNVTSNNYYRLHTDEYLSDVITSTSTTNVATANVANTLNNLITSGVAAAFLQANGAFAAANNVAPQVQPIFIQANSAYSRANTSANTFIGTTGSISPTNGIINFTSNNGITVVATSANTFAISDPQDLRTTASPSFNALTLTNALAINQGGTGATSSGAALTSLLPTGTTAGYVLTTGGPGSFYWAASSGGGGGGTTPGTTINSTRLTYTGTGSQTAYTAPTYVVGASQLRAYINGVRQFPSEYTETSSTQVTFNTAPLLNDVVLIEVDGYINNPYYANNIVYGPATGSIPVSANTIQLAIDNLENRKAALAGAGFTGVVTGLTMPAGTSNTALATTSFVTAFANSGYTLTSSITGNAGTVTNGVVTSGSYADPSWITSLASSKITGTFASSKITGLAASATTDTTNASNITSGTLPNAQLPASISVTNLTAASGGITTYKSGGSTGQINLHNGTTYYLYFDGTNYNIGGSTSNGFISPGNVTAYSDARLKKNITTIDNALLKVNSMRGVYYENLDGQKNTGVVAQEIQNVLPEVVRESNDEQKTLSVAYGNISGILIEAIKELTQQVNELKAEIDVLKGNIK